MFWLCVILFLLLFAVYHLAWLFGDWLARWCKQNSDPRDLH